MLPVIVRTQKRIVFDFIHTIIFQFLVYVLSFIHRVYSRTDRLELFPFLVK